MLRIILIKISSKDCFVVKILQKIRIITTQNIIIHSITSLFLHISFHDKLNFA
jgi:hypothetical protein